ncbi:MAG TPA: endo alpha-1,4 polygalactosaminidase [Candidatus Hydrogenedentes bacterium]|nr:endo alpha-1,4 polygalactosaminidase [Candidatus Hydrogenedentota bacterium]HRT19399.1 endo alpha-1,4 polygalactosaminidase [Candidatus Hydrogenedentota bacterium]HRT63867.1 endo alpha-1,4 polygalactosaminidase [Candidatus Hydrogenedentota bacterium]
MRTSFSLSTGVLLIALAGCCLEPEGDRDFRQDMRAFVQSISAHAKTIAPDFIVIPQNGQELLSLNGESDGPPAQEYMNAIDGVGREDLFYGFTNDNVATPANERDYLLGFLELALAHGIRPLVTDYCWDHAKMDNSYASNAARGYLGFAADHRELDNIPGYPSAPYLAHNNDVNTLADAKNFLYLINPGGYPTKDAFLSALRATDYDLFIMDLFFQDETLSSADIESLKTKAGGGRRLVVAYMSIGEAEDYRYYWQSAWSSHPPSWIAAENPDWPGNYKVRYWDPAWQAVILGSADAYLDRILAAGFDGVYLDIIDAFEYFEETR